MYLCEKRLEIMLLSQLATIVHGKLIGKDREFNGVSIDSRTLKSNELFIPIVGENFNGHAYLDEVQTKNAAGALIAESETMPANNRLAYIKVPNPQHALSQLAAHHRQQFSIPIIALTGSCGKTTVKEMIASILRQVGPVLYTQGNLNTEIGVALTLLQLTAEYQFVVLEMGANHPGEIASTVKVAHPLAAALVNNVHPAHLAGFKSLAGIAEAKGAIYQGLGKEGVAIVNADDNFASFWQKQLTNHKIISFGLEATAEFSAQIKSSDSWGHQTFEMHTPAGNVELTLPVPGQHNIKNAMAAAAACFALGIPLSAIQKGLQEVPRVKGRLCRTQGIAGATIIDDTYNANLGSVNVALEVLAGLPLQRMFIFGDMAELGDAMEAHHTEIGKIAKMLGIDAMFTCGNFSRLAFDAFAGRGQHFTNKTELVAAVKPLLDKNTAVLIKGSRSARMEEIVKELLISN